MQYFQKWKIRRSFLDEHKSLPFSSDREEAKSGSHTTLPVQNIPLQHSIALAKSLQRVDTCRLEQLLSSYPIFVSIIQGLHYSDLICLSQTSSNMYQRVLGNSRPVSLSQLRLLCCDEDVRFRSSCWSCKALICKVCGIRHHSTFAFPIRQTALIPSFTVVSLPPPDSPTHHRLPPAALQTLLRYLLLPPTVLLRSQPPSCHGQMPLPTPRRL
jgi:hypothetical protein